LNSPPGGGNRPSRPAADEVLEVEQVADILVGVMSRTLEERLLAELRLDITAAQAHLLRDLSLHEERTMAQVADALRLTRPAATKLVDRLERKSLVERFQPEKGDRRRIQVRLTREGLQLAQGIRAERRARLSRVLALMPPDHRRQLVDRLREFISLTIVHPDLVEELCRHCGSEHTEVCVVNEAHQRLMPGTPLAT
jgi:DNA-binding MarR family transcriptional regulator